MASPDRSFLLTLSSGSARGKAKLPGCQFDHRLGQGSDDHRQSSDPFLRAWCRRCEPRSVIRHELCTFGSTAFHNLPPIKLEQTRGANASKAVPAS